MNYNTFLIRRLIRLSKADSGPDPLEFTSVDSSRVYERYVACFDRTQCPVPTTAELVRAFLGLLGVERSEKNALLSDAAIAETIDRNRLHELHDLNRILLLALLQSSSQSQVNLSWLWKAEEETPVLLGSSNDNSSRVAMEGTLRDIIAAIWHRFTSSLQRLEDSVLNGYDFCITKYINFAKKGLTDTGGRPVLQLKRVPRVRRRELLTSIEKEANAAANYLTASLNYAGAAGTRGNGRRRVNDMAITTPGCSKAAFLCPKQYYNSPEVELQQAIVAFAHAVLIRDSFVSRRLMSSRLCQLGSIVFEPHQLYRILANMSLNPQSVNSDIAQSVFFNIRGYFVKGGATITEALTQKLLDKLRVQIAALIASDGRQEAVKDPSVICSLLLQNLARDRNTKTLFVRVRDSLSDFLQLDQDVAFIFY